MYAPSIHYITGLKIKLRTLLFFLNYYVKNLLKYFRHPNYLIGMALCIFFKYDPTEDVAYQYKPHMLYDRL